MNISASFQALSQREKTLLVILGIVVLMAIGTVAFPLLATKETVRPPVSPPAQSVQSVAAVRAVQQPTPADNLKNPFFVPPQHRVAKETAVTAVSGATPAGSIPGAATAKQVNVQPVLSGIVVRGAARMAIIEIGGESETLEVGGSFKGYRVVSISDNQTVLEGPEGHNILNIRR